MPKNMSLQHITPPATEADKRWCVYDHYDTHDVCTPETQNYTNDIPARSSIREALENCTWQYKIHLLIPKVQCFGTSYLKQSHHRVYIPEVLQWHKRKSSFALNNQKIACMLWDGIDSFTNWTSFAPPPKRLHWDISGTSVYCRWHSSNAQELKWQTNLFFLFLNWGWTQNG